MAKEVRERLLDSPTARAKLKVSGKPYYRSIGPELHLGYRKGKDARRWVVRLYLGDGQYRVENIGHADDIADADGVSVLDTGKRKRRLAHSSKGARRVSAKRYTVGMAITDYLEHLDGRPAKEKTRLRLAAYVPPEFADKELGDLTAQT